MPQAPNGMGRHYTMRFDESNKERVWKANLHIHSTFSDGGYSLEEMIEAAVAWGFQYLGFADHFSPWPSPWLYPGCYITTGDVKPYVQCLRELRARYQDTTKIMVGLEIYAVGAAVMRLPFEELQEADFLLFEDIHEDADPILTLRRVHAALPNTVIGLAHCDFSQVNTESLIPALQEMDVFVEVNTAYTHYYRSAEQVFQQLAHTGVLISIGSDAHTTEDITKIDDAEDFVLRLGLDHKVCKLIELLSKRVQRERSRIWD